MYKFVATGSVVLGGFLLMAHGVFGLLQHSKLVADSLQIRGREQELSETVRAVQWQPALGLIFVLGGLVCASAGLWLWYEEVRRQH